VRRSAVGRPEARVPRRWLLWQTAASSVQGCGSAPAGNTGLFIGAAASLCAPTATEADRVQDFGRRARQGRMWTDRWTSWCVVGDERGSSMWQSGLRGRPRCAQCLGKAWCLGRRVARTARLARCRPARKYFTVSLFGRENLQNFEQKCTKW
jgi:hypothetical protein